MRTTLSIDDDVLRAAKSLAAAGQRPVGAVISELARKGLRSESLGSEYGVPVFRVPEDAPPITPEMVRQALDD